jgi:hypothetical protein
MSPSNHTANRSASCLRIRLSTTYGIKSTPQTYSVRLDIRHSRRPSINYQNGGDGKNEDKINNNPIRASPTNAFDVTAPSMAAVATGVAILLGYCQPHFQTDLSFLLRKHSNVHNVRRKVVEYV